MTENKKARLLMDLFQAARAEPNGVSRRGFLAKHPDDAEEVESLIAAGEIQSSDGKHLRLPLLGLNELARVMPEAESVRYLCSHLFDVLRSVFIDRPDTKLSVSEIAVLADMPERKVAGAFGYLLDAPICESWNTSADGLHSNIVVSDRILKYKRFSDVIDAMPARRRSMQSQGVSYTEKAARAVCEAIENLTQAGKRAYIRSVPLAAENILVQRSKGSVERADANKQIQAAIAGLSQTGKIDASVEPQRDWLIKEPLQMEGAIGGSGGVGATEVTSTHSFVHPVRLQELKAVLSNKWDLKRLVRMCEELNGAFERESFIACSMLVRAIVDHVPPIFGSKTFSEVANNYSGSKSFRSSMHHLDQSLRNLADGNLHTQIRRTESLPTQAQITFWADLDKLLEEVIRIVKDDRSQ